MKKNPSRNTHLKKSPSKLLESINNSIDIDQRMYKEDIETAKVIADIQKNYKYPTIMAASAGKNMPKRIIEVGKIVKGWVSGNPSFVFPQ